MKKKVLFTFVRANSCNELAHPLREKDDKIYNLIVQENLYNHYHSQPPLLQKEIKDTMILKFLKQHAN